MNLFKVYKYPKLAISLQVNQLLINAKNDQTSNLDFLEKKIQTLFSISAQVSHVDKDETYFEWRDKLNGFASELLEEQNDKTKTRSVSIKRMALRHFFRESPKNDDDVKLSYKLAQYILNGMYEFENLMSPEAKNMLTVASQEYLTLDMTEYIGSEKMSQIFGDYDKKTTLKAVTLIIRNELTPEIANWFKINFLPNFDRFIIENFSKSRFAESKKLLYMEMEERSGIIEDYIAAKVELIFSYLTISDTIYQSLNPNDQIYPNEIFENGKFVTIERIDHSYLLHKYCNLFVKENVDKNTPNQLIQAHQHMKEYYPYLILECMANRLDNENEDDQRTFRWMNVYSNPEDQAWLAFVKAYKANFWYNQDRSENPPIKEFNGLVTSYHPESEDPETVDEYLLRLLETIQNEEENLVTSALYVIGFEEKFVKEREQSALKLGSVSLVGEQIIENNKNYKFQELPKTKDLNEDNQNDEDEEQDNQSQYDDNEDIYDDFEEQDDTPIDGKIIDPKKTRPQKDHDLNGSLDLNSDDIESDEDESNKNRKKNHQNGHTKTEDEIDEDGLTIEEILKNEEDSKKSIKETNNDFPVSQIDDDELQNLNDQSGAFKSNIDVDLNEFDEDELASEVDEEEESPDLNEALRQKKHESQNQTSDDEDIDTIVPTKSESHKQTHQDQHIPVNNLTPEHFDQNKIRPSETRQNDSESPIKKVEDETERKNLIHYIRDSCFF